MGLLKLVGKVVLKGVEHSAKNGTLPYHAANVASKFSNGNNDDELDEIDDIEKELEEELEDEEIEEEPAYVFKKVSYKRHDAEISLFSKKVEVTWALSTKKKLSKAFAKINEDFYYTDIVVNKYAPVIAEAGGEVKIQLKESMFIVRFKDVIKAYEFMRLIVERVTGIQFDSIEDKVNAKEFKKYYKYKVDQISLILSNNKGKRSLKSK